MAMLNEVVTDKVSMPTNKDLKPEDKVLDYYSDVLESELMEASQSYDVSSGMGFIGGHRHRSNTAQRLERLKKERQIQAKITHIHWKECPSQLSETELKELFPKKDLSTSKAKLAVKSALTEALELFPAIANNPFNEFARFDGRINHSAASKKILIYLMMLPPRDRNYGMEVVCLSNARVLDLVGLICWMHTSEGKEPKLQPPASNYCLKIAEETGEVDEDFPNLDGNEFVGKFGFPYLALLEREKNESFCVTVYFEDETIRFEVPSLELTLREVADLASEKVAVRESKAYHIEKPDEPGIAVPLDSKLLNFKKFVFHLVFEDSWQLSSRERIQRAFGTEEYDTHMRAVEAPLYRSYNVSYYQKMGMNHDVQLGISAEKVEINPLPQKGAAKLFSRPQKPTTYYMESVAACEILSKKYSPGKCIFKLIHYTGSEFKKYIFETDPQTAQDIVKKVQIILEMHTSSACKEYQMHREKKLQKKMQKSHAAVTKT